MAMSILYLYKDFGLTVQTAWKLYSNRGAAAPPRTLALNWWAAAPPEPRIGSDHASCFICHITLLISYVALFIVHVSFLTVHFLCIIIHV